MSVTIYLLGGLTMFLTATMGGITGFGASLLSTPTLLLLGLPLRSVVIVNLATVLVTRGVTALRLREHVSPRRPALLVLGSIPGLYCGTLLLGVVDVAFLKRFAGMTIILATIIQVASMRRPPPPRIPGAPVVAGWLGGVLGATTSLNGIPPAILLARDRAAPRSFQADLALYFVCSNAIGLALLAARGAFIGHALVPTALVWMPGALLGNTIGTALGGRLPDRHFLYIAFALAGIAGAITALTA
ncbi:MAG TPA: TSUP family transporter [Thermomicrobiales bacterium]